MTEETKEAPPPKDVIEDLETGILEMDLALMESIRTGDLDYLAMLAQARCTAAKKVRQYYKRILPA